MHCVHACMHLRCQMTWVSTHNQSRCIKSFSFSFFQPKSVKGSFPKTLLVSDKSACVATGFYCSFPPHLLCVILYSKRTNYSSENELHASVWNMQFIASISVVVPKLNRLSSRACNQLDLLMPQGEGTANPSHTDTSSRKNRYPQQDQLPSYNQSIKATSWHLKTNQPIKYWNLADRLPQAKIIGTDEESKLWRRCNMLTHSNMNTVSCQECKRNKK